MVVVYGSRRYLKLDGSLGQSVCTNCGYTTEKTLGREMFSMHIFYIPIFRRTSRRVVICPTCGMERQLTSAEYKQLKQTIRK